MPTLISRGLVAVCLILMGVARAETSAFTGHFQGTGRACYGTLAIQAHTISWVTPFSQCKSVPYQLIDRNAQKGWTRMIYRLDRQTGSCRYAILALAHTGPAADTGWEATGYASEQSYQSDKSSHYQTRRQDMMSCYLTLQKGQ